MHQDVHIYYFTKGFLTFERFLIIWISKYVFIFLLDFLFWFVHWTIFYLMT
jgi:hypothetical protein